MSAIDPTAEMIRVLETMELDMLGRSAIIQGRITRSYDMDSTTPQESRARLLMCAEQAELRLLVARLRIRAHDLRHGIDKLL